MVGKKPSNEINPKSNPLKIKCNGIVDKKAINATRWFGATKNAAEQINTTIPQLFPNAQSFDFVFFLDAANIWGVDYDSSIDDTSEIRSSIGIGVDYLTIIGPLSFSLSQVISKSDNDIEETFRFNLGTTF